MPTSRAPQRRFTVDAKAVLTLGRNSIRDHTTAVVELIKNAYDADADCVELFITTQGENGGFIRIADNGHGMTDPDIQNNWLRIGFSEKVSNKTSSRFRRRKTGEKGIGRLSADRLGAVLELRTRARAHAAVGIQVNWEAFDKAGAEVSDIELPSLHNPIPKTPARQSGGTVGTGTELYIRKLRQEWTEGDMRRLHSELSLLLPPYQQLAKNFALNFHNDLTEELNGPITYDKDAVGEIEFTGRLQENGTLKYTISFRDPANRSRRVAQREQLAWSELAPDEGSSALRGKSLLGKLELRLSYYVRRSDFLEGTGLDLARLREFLDRNAGVRIYRDLVRVKPYGDPGSSESDWLGLADRKLRAPDAATRATFKVAANQIVGAVFIGRDGNAELVDSSSREGLIENDAFRQLKAVLMRSVVRIEAKYHELSLATQPQDKSSTTKAKAAVKQLSTNLATLRTDLTSLQRRVEADFADDAGPVLEQIESVLEQVTSAAKEIDEIASQNTVYRGLATVGIASAVFGHETALAVSQAKAKLSNSAKWLERQPPDVEKASLRIREADQYLDQVASWGRFALSRVKKDKRQRRRVNIGDLVAAVLDDLEQPMTKSDVVLRRSLRDEVLARTFPMDVEAVTVNFLTNAYYEVKKKSRNRIIHVKLTEKKAQGKDGFEISVIDSGGGITAKDLPLIWEPLYSTRIDEQGRANGTGLGLAIVKSAVEEMDGKVSASASSSLGGAAFSAWFPKGM